MQVIKLILSHLDPRAPFTRSKNTVIQFGYVGLVAQASLLLYSAIYFLTQRQLGIGFFGVAIDFVCFLSLLQLGIEFLNGVRSSRLWIAGYSAIQVIYYGSWLLEHSQRLPHSATLFGFISGLFTFYLVTRPSVSEYIKDSEDRRYFR